MLMFFLIFLRIMIIKDLTPYAIAGAGLSMNLVGTSYASDSSELAGWSGWQVIFGVGPASIQGSTEGGDSLGVGPSIGAGVGAIRCYTKELSCNCPCKAK